MRTILLPLLLVLPGCATIVASSTESFAVDSEPPGATIKMNGNIVGTTPASIEIPRKVEHIQVDVLMDGFSTQSCQVGHHAGGGFIVGDVLLSVIFFPIGLISWIDASGAWNQLEMEQCRVQLRPTSSNRYAPPPARRDCRCAQMQAGCFKTCDEGDESCGARCDAMRATCESSCPNS